MPKDQGANVRLPPQLDRPKAHVSPRPGTVHPLTARAGETAQAILVDDWAPLPVATRPLVRAISVIRDYLPRGQSLSDDVWLIRHRVLSTLLRVHVAGIFVFALVRGFSVSQSLTEAGVVAVFAVLASTDHRRRRFVSSMSALGLVTSSAVLVQLSGGLIEMHFHFFVMVGILTLYQDWLPFLLAIGFVVLHHGVLGLLDPYAVYNHPDAVAHPMVWALIHGGFVLAASAASVVAWRLNEEHSYRDALTRLPNRALLQLRVCEALNRAGGRRGALAMLFVDLDGFKDVNDSLGHAAGDQLLCAVAARLRSCVRHVDTAARLGGDEFAVLLENLTAETAAIGVARRLQDALAMPFLVAGQQRTVTASVGIAVNGQDDDVDALLRNADVAMYIAKENGRSRYELFANEMHAAVVRRVELEQQLQHAVDADELTLHYQPIVRLETGEVAGLEALLRWEHPSRGLLMPAEFMDSAFRTGAIVPIGKWVLETACRQAAAWRRQPGAESLTVSVNLSAAQVLGSDLVEQVKSALTRSGLEPSALLLELTEDALVADITVAASRLAELKAHGVHLAVDDFGTGYSSLNYLRQLPFDVLKIDKAFIDGITTPTEVPLVHAIVSLAHMLGLRTVAEGVETAEQADALRSLGCRGAQGYYFSRPLTAHATTVLISQGNGEPTQLPRSEGPAVEYTTTLLE